MKPKEWLTRNGHLNKVTRGRISAEHKQLIEAALIADPTLIIEGFATTTKSTGESSPEPKVTVNRVQTSNHKVIADLPDVRRDERDWTAHVNIDGKSQEIGFRTVDNGCGSSLAWCYCPTSRVWVNNTEHVVTFKPQRGDR